MNCAPDMQARRTVAHRQACRTALRSCQRSGTMAWAPCQVLASMSSRLLWVQGCRACQLQAASSSRPLCWAPASTSSQGSQLQGCKACQLQASSASRPPSRASSRQPPCQPIPTAAQHQGPSSGERPAREARPAAQWGPLALQPGRSSSCSAWQLSRPSSRSQPGAASQPPAASGTRSQGACTPAARWPSTRLRFHLAFPVHPTVLLQQA